MRMTYTDKSGPISNNSVYASHSNKFSVWTVEFWGTYVLGWAEEHCFGGPEILRKKM